MRSNARHVFWVVFLASVFSGTTTQPTVIDWDYCQDNSMLREMSRKMDLLTQQYKLFSISLGKFEEYGTKNAEETDNRLTELDKRQEKKISDMESVINSQVSQLESSLTEVALNITNTFRLQLESQIDNQEAIFREREATGVKLSETLNASLDLWTTDSFDKKLAIINQLLTASERFEIKYDDNFKQIVTALETLTGRTNEALLDQLTSMTEQMFTSIENQIGNLSTEYRDTVADGINQLVSLFQNNQNIDLVTLLQNDSLLQNEAIISNVHDINHITNLKIDESKEQMERLLNVSTTDVKDFILGIVKSTLYIQQGTLRLINGTTITEGRVEIYYEGKWGTVCDDEWSDEDAEVVCRQLGFCGGVALKQAGYGPGHSNVPIYLDQVECGGGEISLLLCSKSAFNDHDCSHGEDAGVKCNLCS